MRNHGETLSVVIVGTTRTSSGIRDGGLRMPAAGPAASDVVGLASTLGNARFGQTLARFPGRPGRAGLPLPYREATEQAQSPPRDQPGSAAPSDAAAAITAAAGPAGAARAQRLIAFARRGRIPLEDVQAAMAAGGDPLLSGIAYAVLRSQAHDLAPLIRSGRVRVAAGRPPIVSGPVVAAYSTSDNPAMGARRDTLYIRPTASIDSLNQRGLIIHEAEHGRQDQRGRPMTNTQAEVGAYRRHARYLLSQLQGAAPAALPGLATSLRPSMSRSLLAALTFEAQSDVTAHRAAYTAIVGASNFHLTPAQAAVELARPHATVEARLNAVVSSENAAARPGWVGSASAGMNGIPASR